MINETLESSIIGALCLDESLCKAVVEEVIEDDFQTMLGRSVIKTVFDCMDDGKKWDCTVAAEAAGSDTIRELMRLTPTTHNCLFHARQLHEEGRERRLVEAVSSALNSSSGEDMASRIKESCTEYLSGGKMATVKPLGKALEEAYSNLTEDKGLRIDTGYSGIDKILKGMYPGNLVIIGARPGVGKSAFSLDLSVRAARMGHKVMLFSMEMLADELAERVIAQNSSVVMDKMIDRNLDSEDFDRIRNGISSVYHLPITIVDTPSVTVPFIRARAQQVDGLDMIVVDYIGLMQSSGKHESRNLELGQISRDLKNLATELKIPVIALAQLNRALDDSEEPRLSSLRDSGELEQNANKVLFLWNQDKENGVVGVSVAKNRRGRTGSAYLRFYGELMKYVEIENYIPPEKSKQVSKPTMR